jgi:SAM-dependent methyltransferase
MSNAEDARVAYAVGAFRDPQAELRRLQQQAAVLADAEEAALDALGMPAAGDVLDLGCGPGFVAERIQKRRVGLKVVGVDRDPEIVAQARGRLPAFEGDAASLPFESSAFDCVLVRLVLRHLDRPDRALAEVHRVLRPHGRAIVIDSDDDALILEPWPPAFRRALAARQETFRRRGADPLIGRRLSALLGGAGFGELAIRPLVVDSVSVGLGPFARIVLSPVVDGIDRDLLGPEETGAAARAVDAWAASESAFGMTTVLAVGGRKIG